MSSTAAKCRSRSRRWAPQNGLMQRCAMYGSSRTTSPPHTGHVAGTVDRHLRADVNALLVDLGLVVHRDVAHRHAADDHRADMRHRREHPRSADVALDRLDDGLGLLW